MRTDSGRARPAVSVIVPTRDRAESLRACLASLEHQDAGSFEVVVVDDDSLDTRAVAEVVADAPHARLIRGTGRGPAAARNLGARAARGAVLCFCDDDCRPEPTWLAALRRRIDAGSHVVAGPTRVDSGNPYAVAAQVVANSLLTTSLDRRSGRVAFAPTSNVACRADVHEQVPFDDRYPLAAGEDRAWCRSLAEHGIPIDFEPDAAVDHHPDLAFATFWRQQVRYGRGAYRFHRDAPPGARHQPLAFYRRLVHDGFAHGVGVGALVVLAQVATGVGLLRAATGERHRGGHPGRAPEPR